MNAKPPGCLVVDLGGTHFRMSCTSETGQILKSAKIQTHSVDSLREGLTELSSQVDPDHEYDFLVMAVPGVLDYKEQRVVYAANLPDGWEKELSAEFVAACVSREAVLVNDADLGAIGEAYCGAGQGYGGVCYVTVSTGIGAGVVSEGRLIHGRLSLAELGHSIIDACVADKSGAGSAEVMASGTALSQRLEEAGLDITDSEAVRRAYEKSEEDCVEILADISYLVSVSLTNLAYMFSPDILVLGGGLGLSSPHFIEQVGEHYRELAPPYLSGAIVSAALGDDAALTGGPFAKAALSI